MDVLRQTQSIGLVQVHVWSTVPGSSLSPRDKSHHRSVHGARHGKRRRQPVATRREESGATHATATNDRAVGEPEPNSSRDGPRYSMTGRSSVLRAPFLRRITIFTVSPTFRVSLNHAWKWIMDVKSSFPATESTTSFFRSPAL